MAKGAQDGDRTPYDNGALAAGPGASGYAGGELLRLISGHPVLELGTAAAAASAGTPVTGVHPHLPALGDRAFEALDPARLAAADLVFLALPHEESGKQIRVKAADLVAQKAYFAPH